MSTDFFTVQSPAFRNAQRWGVPDPAKLWAEMANAQGGSLTDAAETKALKDETLVAFCRHSGTPRNVWDPEREDFLNAGDRAWRVRWASDFVRWYARRHPEEVAVTGEAEEVAESGLFVTEEAEKPKRGRTKKSKEETVTI